jgi:hypothetical protein
MPERERQPTRFAELPTVGGYLAGEGAGRAGRARPPVDVARRVQPRAAARRGVSRRAPGAARSVISARNRAVPVWSPCGPSARRGDATPHPSTNPSFHRTNASLAQPFARSERAAQTRAW